MPTRTTGLPFQIVGGSIPGINHLYPHVARPRNNHDAYYWARSGDGTCLVAIVSDGCGAAAHPEVGSWLTVRLLTKELLRVVGEHRANNHTTLFTGWDAATAMLLREFDRLAHAMGGPYRQTVWSYFLATVLGVVVTPEWTYVFGAGDGYFAINGKLTRIGPFPNDDPPYPAYTLTKAMLTNPSPDLRQCTLRVHTRVKTTSVKTLVVATDGFEYWEAARKMLSGEKQLAVGDVTQFANDHYFEKKTAITDHFLKIGDALCLRGKKYALMDDLTLISISRTT